jgi:Pyruvate/2-oxoacid:ferredoxin oxidoreductase delta subunit
MITKNVRKVVKIDETLCNGCGACLISCAEGALQIVNGKAKLVSDRYCDGLGACLGKCPQGAITVEERPAEEFDEKAAQSHLQSEKHAGAETPCGCPSAAVTRFKTTSGAGISVSAADQVSRLSHWPVQLTLVPPSAPFLKGADLVLAADCTPFAYPGFHRDFLGDKALLVACPKLDDFQAHQDKLTEILRQSGIKSLTVVRMEVPCCSGLVHMAKQAMLASAVNLPLKEVVIGIRGDRKSG